MAKPGCRRGRLRAVGPRFTGLLFTLSAVIVLPLAGTAYAAAAAPATGPAPAPASPRPVRSATLAATLADDAAATLADAPAAGPVRLSVATTANGRLTVRPEVAPDRVQAKALVLRVLADPAVVAVGLSRAVHLATTLSNDPQRAQQWAMTTLDAEHAWSVHTAAGVIVAVIDSGVQRNHPDLASVVLPGTDLVTPGGDGGNDLNGHGTHVAGIVDAVANNGIGVAGLAQQAQILPIRVTDAAGSGTSTAVAQGVSYAVARGAKVINMSLTMDGDDTALGAAVADAIAHNVVVVAAAGNSAQASDPILLPAAYPGVIGVAAVDNTLAAAAFSEYGPQVDLAAPGVGVLSTYAGSPAYQYMSGTSMASPYVAASAALLLAANPVLTPTAVESRLERNATDLGAPGHDDHYGYGLVSPYGALTDAVGPSPIDTFVAAYTAAHGATTVGASLGPETPVAGGLVRQFANMTVYWSSATEAHEVHGMILGRYLAAGGPGGFLGWPRTDETTDNNVVGRHNDFVGGAVYWSPGTAAHELHGMILDRFRALGGDNSQLGFPATDETPTPDGVGRFNHFTGGSVYWSPPTGAHAVWGAIRTHWQALGWELGPLGYPTTDETVTADGVGRYNGFAHGQVFWSPQTSAYAVWGAIASHWVALGSEAGHLGYPVTDETPTPDRIGRFNHFVGGSVYWTPSTGAYAVWGAIRAQWSAMGWETSWLGYPTSDEYPIPGGAAENFAGGVIRWTPGTGAVPSR